MKNLFSILAVSVLYIVANSQTPSWQWGRAAGDVGNDLGYAISTDENGNSYTTGRFNNTGIFGTQFVTSFGGPDIYVAKYDTYGNCLWVRNGGSIDAQDVYGDEGRGIGADAGGNCIVTGTFKTSADFGPFHLGYIFPKRGIFVVKYHTNGFEMWAKQDSGSQANNYSRALAVDASGSSYITGYLGGGTNYFDSYALDGPGAFVVKFDSLGNVVYATKLAKFGGIDANGISVDSSGNAYVTGYLQGTDSINGQAFTSTGDRDAFVIRLDASGAFQWLKQSRSIAGTTAYGTGVATDPQGNALVTGYFDNVVQFGTTTLTINSGGHEESFIVKYSPAGNIKWARQTRSGRFGSRTESMGITSDVASNAVITGSAGGDSVAFGSSHTIVIGIGEVYVALYDSSGNCQWAVAALGFNPGAYSQGISTDNHGSYYITGYDKGPPTFGNDVLEVFGQEDIFVAKIGVISCSQFSTNVTANNTVICSTDSAQFCAASGFAHYLWNTGETSRCIDAHQAGNYYVTVTDNNGCTAESNHLALTVLPQPPVSISINGDTLSVYGAVTQQWFLNGNLLTGETDSIYIAPHGGSYTVMVTDTNGCAATSSPVIILGIDNVTEEDVVSVYPNPLEFGMWNVECGSNFIGGTAEIIDADGRVVFQSAIRNSQSEIALALSRGVYLLRISSGKSSVVRKLIRL